MGLLGYYRKFIDQYANVSMPLTDLLCKDRQYIWSRACQKAFETLKNKLCSAEVLAYPDEKLQKKLNTNASGCAISGVLVQVMPNSKERLLGYFSRILCGPELAYFALERECLAIIKLVKHFRPYLYGCFFIVETDHQALTTLQRMAIMQKDPNSRFMRWLMALQEYHYKILYKKGVNNSNTDGLTRYPHKDNPTESLKQRTREDQE